MVGLDLIRSEVRRQHVMERLASAGPTVVDLTPHQIKEFAGNAIELQGRDGLVLVLPGRAYRSQIGDQKDVIQRSCTMLPVHVPTIDLAGGSVGCMIAGIHLSRREVLDHAPGQGLSGRLPS